MTVPEPTLLDRLVRAGISEHRARTWIDSGGVRVNGEVATDPDMLCPDQRWSLHPG